MLLETSPTQPCQGAFHALHHGLRVFAPEGAFQNDFSLAQRRQHDGLMRTMTWSGCHRVLALKGENYGKMDMDRNGRKEPTVTAMFLRSFCCTAFHTFGRFEWASHDIASLLVYSLLQHGGPFFAQGLWTDTVPDCMPFIGMDMWVMGCHFSPPKSSGWSMIVIFWIQ